MLCHICIVSLLTSIIVSDQGLALTMERVFLRYIQGLFIGKSSFKSFIVCLCNLKEYTYLFFSGTYFILFCVNDLILFLHYRQSSGTPKRLNLIQFPPQNAAIFPLLPCMLLQILLLLLI